MTDSHSKTSIDYTFMSFSYRSGGVEDPESEEYSLLQDLKDFYEGLKLGKLLVQQGEGGASDDVEGEGGIPESEGSALSPGLTINPKKRKAPPPSDSARVRDAAMSGLAPSK